MRISMSRSGGRLLWFVLSIVVIRCATQQATTTARAIDAAPPGGLAAAIAVAVDAVDPNHEATLVAGEKLTPVERAAAGSGGRKVLDMQSVPETSEATMPRGYLRIESATLAGDEANVRLFSGPVPKPRPGVMLMSCGTTHTFRLKRGADGRWMIASRGFTVC